MGVRQYNMTVWWRALILLYCVLHFVEFSAPSAVPQRNKYKNSFRLTRTTRTRVQQLQRKYKEQQLGNKHFEDRSRQLKDLPSLSTDFNSWLKLTDWERLHAAFCDMQAYWNMLEWKRKQLEMEEKEQIAERVVRTTISQSIRHIQLDLRDLMKQVSSQLSYMQSSWMKPTSHKVQEPLNPETSSKTVWDRRVEGYIILRDLDLYLTKLARDFLLLASKI
ncbi:uncharacterized protein LOC123962749 isoform X2 [Micropterus dolomieu]|uniref:uncharacterized protein LOC123962749 isoform X2 n=1 Tax=Micropterus dolomieu TaxID=147949 RepID=UPI001E8DA054|nr:uncharacterized protein LOC123962749 isoform X2 [Micropterus dolomieu]